MDGSIGGKGGGGWVLGEFLEWVELWIGIRGTGVPCMFPLHFHANWVSLFWRPTLPETLCLQKGLSAIQSHQRQAMLLLSCCLCSEQNGAWLATHIPNMSVYHMFVQETHQNGCSLATRTANHRI